MGFARILKDITGKPSGYRECDGEVAFMPEQESYENIFRKVKIDAGTMKVLNHDFIKDKDRVYRRGVLLRGITPEDFHLYNAVFIGNRQIIFTPYGDAKIAHPDSFEALDDGMQNSIFPYSYGRDGEFAYFFIGSTDTKHALKIKACKNPARFTVLSDRYAVDGEHVYYESCVLKKADPDSFTVLGDGRARDKRHFFHCGNITEE